MRKSEGEFRWRARQHDEAEVEEQEEATGGKQTRGVELW